MKNLKLTAVIFCLLVVFIGSTFAQQRQMKDGKRGRMYQELNLTQDQKEKIQEFRLNHKEYVIDIQTQIKKNRLEIEKLLMDDNFNESRLLDISHKNSELRAQIKDSRLKMLLSAYKILDTDQKKLWKRKFMRNGMENGRKAFKQGMKNRMHNKPCRF